MKAASCFYLFILFSFGLCLGSFLNCLVYRLNHNRSPLEGRSFCPKCKHQLAWYDNLPLLSFFLLRGKCRYCHSPISWQYPLVELATGMITVFSLQYLVFSLQLDWLAALYYLLIAYALIAIFVSDLRYGTIPDEIVFPAIGLAALFHLRGVLEAKTWIHLGGVLLPGLAVAGFFLFLALVTRGKGMGMGDVKLAGLMGLVLGWPKIIIALYLAFLTGAIVGVILILVGKKHFGEQVPFGPFLVASTIISFFWGGIIWQNAALLL